VRKGGLQLVEQTGGRGRRVGFRNHDSVLEQKPAADSPPSEL